MTTITVRHLGYMTVMDEDGRFHCPHHNATVVYEHGDGITEPPGGWVVSCPDCHDEDLTENDIERILNEDTEEDYG